jgi:hypothetical protein
MSNEKSQHSEKRKTSKQRRQEMYERMGMKDPKDQVLDFQLAYFKNWMKKLNGGGSQDENQSSAE